MKYESIAVGLTLVICASGFAEKNRLFDIELESGRSISSDTFRGVLPIKFLQTRQDAARKEIVERFDIKDPPERFGFSYDSKYKAFGRIKGDFAFTEFGHKFGQVGPPGQRGEYLLTEISLSGGDPAPARGRVERVLGALIELLGNPDAIYQDTRGIGEWRRITNNRRKFRWWRAGTCLDYIVRRDTPPFWFELRYIPPQALRQLEDARNDTGWLQMDKSDPRGELRSYLDLIPGLPAGDGGFPVLEPADTVAARLEQYQVVTMGRWRVIWDKQYKALAEKLEEAFREDFSSFKSKDQLYAHLLDICRGKIPGFRSGEIQCGAAAYLASFDDPEVIDYLFKAIDVNLPGGVSSYSYDGIARQCTGELMDRVLAMLDSFPRGKIGQFDKEEKEKRDQAGKASRILMSLETEEAYLELIKKLPGLESDDAKSFAQSAANHVEQVLRHRSTLREE